MFPTETSKGTEFLVFIVGGILLVIVIIVAAIALKISDRPDNPDANVESSSEDSKSEEMNIDWGFITDKKDYIDETGKEVYLLTYEQNIGNKTIKRTDRVTQSTYEKFTIGDKFYRASYTEDGIKLFESRNKSSELEE